MTYVFLTVAAVVGLVFQSTLFSGDVCRYFRPDLILLLVTASGFHLPRIPGILFAFVLGYISDTLSGAPEGWNALYMTLVFCLTQVFKSKIFTKGIAPRVSTVAFFSMLKGPCFILVMKIAGHSHSSFSVWFYHWIGEAASTVAATMVIMYFVYRVLGIGTSFLIPGEN